MRLKTKKKPKENDIRDRTFFAWLPVIVPLEIRWLERVTVRQRYWVSCSDSGWENMSFLNNKNRSHDTI